MIKSYILYDEQNKVIQFTRCNESEIEHYNSSHIEIEETEFHFDSNYNYKVENNQVIKTEKTDNAYLLSKINTDYENAVSQLTSSVPNSEISTWTKQESEARSWLIDNNINTPIIDAICTARGCDKEYLVNKIVEKADAYSMEIGKLLGQRQRKEKLILEGAYESDYT